MRRTSSGFTLVELSIVLVILGLLVGGVLTGQSLIRAAELRAVSTEFTRYQTALGTFRDKYFALPGDMPNAVRYWGSANSGSTADGVDSGCAGLTTASTTQATCNGDGDGSIYTWVPNAGLHELFRSWQHLANAGMIEGSYSGVRGPGSVNEGVPGTNVPRSKLANGGWSIVGRGTVSGDSSHFDANYGNSLFFGAKLVNNLTGGPILKAEEAYNIDMKMDDGQPHLGKVLAYKNAASPNCVVAANNAYALSNTAIGCPMIFITGY